MRNAEQEIREKTEALLTAYDSLCRNVRNISVSDFLLLREYAEKMAAGAPAGREEGYGAPRSAEKERASSGTEKKQKKKAPSEQPQTQVQASAQELQPEEVPLSNEDAGEEAFSVFSMLRNMPDPYN